MPDPSQRVRPLLVSLVLLALCPLPGRAQATSEDAAVAPADPEQPAAEIITEEVTYRASKVRAKSFFAAPKKPGRHPGVLVLPEWWGLDDYARKRARMLAELGYAVLAVDLFGNGEKAHRPQQAATLSVRTINDQPELAARFKAAMTYLRRRDESDPEKVAAVGYGFGGDVVLQMARNGTVGLDGVAAFHPFLASLRPPNPPIDKLTAKILVCNGGEDVFIQPAVVEAFKRTMKSVQADMLFVNYPDSMQSFTNPEASKIGAKFNIPFVYDQSADTDSWKRLQTFLTDLWKAPPADE